MWKLKDVKGYFALSRYTYDFHENWPIFKVLHPLAETNLVPRAILKN